MAHRGTILVTGAAQGMGLTTCRLAAAEGYRVAMVDRQGERVRAAAATIAGATAYVVNLLDAAALPSLVGRVEDEMRPAGRAGQQRRDREDTGPVRRDAGGLGDDLWRQRARRVPADAGRGRRMVARGRGRS